MINFAGNVNETFEIQYTPFEYELVVDRKHGIIQLIKRKPKL
jgi:hypothetical protein